MVLNSVPMVIFFFFSSAQSEKVFVFFFVLRVTQAIYFSPYIFKNFTCSDSFHINHLSSSKVLIFKMRWLFQRDVFLSLQLSRQPVQTSLISSAIWTHFKISTHNLWDLISSSNLLQDHVLGQEMDLPSFEFDTFQKGIKFKSCSHVQITLEQHRSLGYTIPLFIYLLSGCTGSQLWHVGSFVVARELSGCGVQAQLLRGMWDLSSLTRD